MASWRKYFVEIPDSHKLEKWLEKRQSDSSTYGSKTNFQTWLPEVYAGPPNRIERYKQYEEMDNGSPEVSKSLDTIAEFCTQKEEKSKEYFEFNFIDEASEPEVQVLNEKLREWTELNDFDKRLWRILRSVVLYGDLFFVRDPETYKWLWIDPYNVEKVIVNEAEGKKPEEYWIANPDLNLQTLNISPSTKPNLNYGYPAGLPHIQQAAGPSPVNNPTLTQTHASSTGSLAVDATHVIHLSLNEGLDSNWPFGLSILENVYKTWKQVSLLEDSVLIYRVHRAPERRVFYIDVGNMPANRAMAHLDKIKNEINQRRIPTRTGGGANILDSTYNPMCHHLSTKIPLLDGRTLELREIIKEYEDGKTNWAYSCHPESGEIIPGIISWAGVTRKQAQVIKLTFDNGKELICTPDHKIPVKGKGFVEAKDLTKTDNLFSLDTRKSQKSISIEWLDKKEDVGTLTIDREEKFHNYHTYAVAAGIFVKNSMTEDYFFPQTCLSLDTNIPLLDGRTVELKSLIKEYNIGRENYTYSVDQKTGEMEPGKIVWAGVTRKNAELVKVTLDNKKEIVCTPDHRFIMRDGSELEAQDLKENDSLMPLYLVDGQTSKYQNDKRYKRYICNKDGKVKWVHTMVCPKIEPGRDTEIHHIDFNSLNNNPTNLIEMNTKEHRELHRKTASENLKNRWNDEEGRKDLLEGMKNLYENADENFIQMIIERNRKNAKNGWKNKSNSGREKDLKKLEESRKIAHYQTRIDFNDEIFEKFLEITKFGLEKNLNIYQLSDFLTSDREFMSLIITLNSDKKVLRRFKRFCIGKINKLCKWKGYSGYKELKDSLIDKEKYSDYLKSRIRTVHLLELNRVLKKKRLEEYESSPTSCQQCSLVLPYSKRVNKFCSNSCATTYNNLNGKIGRKSRREKNEFYNHKVVSVEFLEYKEDTGCITVESNSGSHNFALDAGIFVHNSEGRGSRVETLPSGTQLGEINDLNYFLTQLKRGLNVPSAYIASGSQEETGVYNDGRATTALIAEYRFSKYCERVQALVNDIFDREFKLYLKADGVNIDSKIFNLTLNTPQNFAKYRQIELDNAMISTWSQIADIPYISKRFAMKRWLGMTEDEIVENEKMWKEENPDKTKTGETGDLSADGDLRTLGVRPDIEDPGAFGEEDFETPDDIEGELGAESPISGAETAGEVPTPPGPPGT